MVDKEFLKALRIIDDLLCASSLRYVFKDPPINALWGFDELHRESSFYKAAFHFLAKNKSKYSMTLAIAEFLRIRKIINPDDSYNDPV